MSLEVGLGRPGGAGTAGVYVQRFPGWKLSALKVHQAKGCGESELVCY